MGDGVLIGAIVVHHPDFFGVLAENFDVEDFGFGDAGNAATEAQDDLVGKLMGDLAGRVIAGGVAILLREDLGILSVLRVEEEAIDDQFAAIDADGAEGDEGCTGGRVGVGLDLHLGGRAGSAGGHQAFGDDVEDASGGEVGVEGAVEGLLQLGSLGIGAGGLEVGDGDADHANAAVDAPGELILPMSQRDERGQSRGQRQS